MKLAVSLIVVGIGLMAYARSMPAYTDEALFRKRYMAIPSGASEEYWKLRDEMLTPKFKLQDYGATLVFAALMSATVASRGYSGIRAPSTRVALVAIAISLPVVSAGGYVLDLHVAASREEFPHWADSIGIPLMGVPILFAVNMAWALVHLAFMPASYPQVAPLASAISSRANWWLLALSSLSILLLVFTLAFGDVLYAPSGTLWVYFYLSLAAARRVAHDA